MALVEDVRRSRLPSPSAAPFFAATSVSIFSSFTSGHTGAEAAGCGEGWGGAGRGAADGVAEGATVCTAMGCVAAARSSACRR